MRFAEDITDAQYLIRGYAPDQVTVNDDVLIHSFVISADQLIRDWPVQTFEQLNWEQLQVTLTFKPEIIIIGTGSRLRLLPPELIARIQAQGIGVEIMDTAAACRTYNILITEQRKVTAAILLDNTRN